MKHVSPGDPFVPQADVHNRTVDFLMASRDREGANTPGLVEGNNYAYVINDTGAALTRYRGVILYGVDVGFDDDEVIEDYGIVFSGETADQVVSDRRGAFGVTQEEIAAGEVGLVMVRGISPCYIDNPANLLIDTENMWVKLQNSISGAFEVTRDPAEGTARLLWFKTASPGEQLAVIRFPENRNYGWWARVKGPGSAQYSRDGFYADFEEVEYNPDQDTWDLVMGGITGGYSGSPFIKEVNDLKIPVGAICKVLEKKVDQYGAVYYLVDVAARCGFWARLHTDRGYYDATNNMVLYQYWTEVYMTGDFSNPTFTDVPYGLSGSVLHYAVNVNAVNLPVARVASTQPSRADIYVFIDSYEKYQPSPGGAAQYWYYFDQWGRGRDENPQDIHIDPSYEDDLIWDIDNQISPNAIWGMRNQFSLMYVYQSGFKDVRIVWKNFFVTVDSEGHTTIVSDDSWSWIDFRVSQINGQYP